MNNLRTILNPRGENGGTEIGWSALSQYARCPMQWALAELLPHPHGGKGIHSRAGRALIVGTLVHSWLEGWYRSDPEGGNYEADAGFAALDAAKEQFTEDDLFQTSASNKVAPLSEATDLCRRYGLECRKSGPDPDCERFQIAIDAEGPLIERSFRVDLGYGGYYFTTRVDTIGWSKIDDNTIVIAEHKTCDVSKRHATLLDLALSGQLCGETLAVKLNLKHDGVITPCINLIQKRAAKDGTCRIWEPVEKEQADLDKFRLDMVRLLKLMDENVAEYQDLLKAGVPPLTAIRLVFRANAPREVCAGMGFQCFAYEICRSPRHANKILLGTAPRFPPAEVPTEGENNVVG